MIHAWSSDAVLSVVFFLLLVPVALLPALYRLYGRYGRFAGGPAVLLAVAGLVGCSLVAFTLFPLPAEDALRCDKGPLPAYWQLDPTTPFREIAAVASSSGWLAALTSRETLQVSMNVVFFVPLGVLAGYRAGLGLGRTLALGFVVSLAIELTQGTGLWGIYPCPYRLLATDDLAMNTLGAGVGWLVGRTATAVVPWRTPERVPDLGAPSLRRRAGATAADLVAVVLLQLAVELVVILVLAEAPAEEQRAALVVADVGALLLLFGLPMVRRDRATPGAWATWLAVGRPSSPGPAARWRVLLALGLRWLPALLTGLESVLVATFLVEGVAVALRRDRRTLTQVVAGTMSRTRRALEADARAPGEA